jgi:hypothetical protein
MAGGPLGHGLAAPEFKRLLQATLDPSKSNVRGELGRPRSPAKP